MTSQSQGFISDISVCVMSYKYGHLAAQCLESILWQTLKPDVINLYDDGVGDCEHLRKIYPEVNVIKRHRNLGIVENFNQALNKVKTERVLFIGADNYLHPEALRLMAARQEDIVSCDAFIVGKGKYYRWKLPWQPHGSALYNVQKAKEVGGYKHSGNKHSEEDSMLFKAMFANGCSFYRVEKPLLYYRYKHRMNFNK